jgi:hypothetical protein
MSLITVIVETARGFGRGFDLLLAGHYGYVEKVTTPRVETRR